jgi:hypothetical protein
MATLVVNNGTPYIEDVWMLEDFRNVADGYDTEEFTDDELIQAMESVVDSFDANYGITWETIESALDLIVWYRNQQEKVS